MKIARRRVPVLWAYKHWDCFDNDIEVVMYSNIRCRKHKRRA